MTDEQNPTPEVDPALGGDTSGQASTPPEEEQKAKASQNHPDHQDEKEKEVCEFC